MRALTIALAAVTSMTAAGQGVAPPRAPAQKAAAQAPAADTALALGSFVSSRIDGKKLPMSDLATDDQGTQFLIEFAELVLTLKPGGEFRAALKYRQTLAAKGQRTSTEPMQKMTVYGSWVRDGQAIRFVPDPKRGGEGLRILAGTAAGRTVTVPFDYQNGRVTKRATVVLVYDPKLF